MYTDALTLVASAALLARLGAASPAPAPAPAAAPAPAPAATAEVVAAVAARQDNILNSILELANALHLTECLPYALPLVSDLPEIPPGLIGPDLISQGLTQTALSDVCDFTVTGDPAPVFTSFAPEIYNWFYDMDAEISSLISDCPPLGTLSQSIEDFETCSVIPGLTPQEPSTTGEATSSTGSASSAPPVSTTTEESTTETETETTTSETPESSSSSESPTSWSWSWSTESSSEEPTSASTPAASSTISPTPTPTPTDGAAPPSRQTGVAASAALAAGFIGAVALL